jgi:hypothetical protein
VGDAKALRRALEHYLTDSEAAGADGARARERVVERHSVEILQSRLRQEWMYVANRGPEPLDLTVVRDRAWGTL